MNNGQWYGDTLKNNALAEDKMHELDRVRMENSRFYDPEVPRRDKDREDLFEDNKPKQPPFPWRRYFARCIDMTIYRLVFECIGGIIFKVNIYDQTILENIIAVLVTAIAMLALEPLFLSKWGTTPGKWILGIRVTSKKHRNLTYKEALQRTFDLWRYGYGFQIPIYSLYRLYKSYSACSNGEYLEWDQDSIIVLMDKKWWRIGAMVTANILLFGLSGLVYSLSLFPVNRGDLTVEEFAKNYNQYANFYGLDSITSLNPDGTFVDLDDGVNYNIAAHIKPKCNYIVEDGIMKGMEFEIDKENVDICPTYQSEIYLSMISFIRAQKGYNPFTDVTRLYETFLENDITDNFRYEAYGVSVDYDVNASDYFVVDEYYWAEEEDGNHIKIIFKMVKE